MDFTSFTQMISVDVRSSAVKHGILSLDLISFLICKQYGAVLSTAFSHCSMQTLTMS